MIAYQRSSTGRITKNVLPPHLSDDEKRKGRVSTEELTKILPEEITKTEQKLILVPCAHCMALLTIPAEEYHSCTHFTCQFCGKITNMPQILLGARWDWTFPDLPHLEN